MKGYDPYKQLVVAIVGRAVWDYKKAMIELEKNSNYETALKVEKEIGEFFHSAWFEFLCEISNVRKILKKENIINDN